MYYANKKFFIFCKHFILAFIMLGSFSSALGYNTKSIAKAWLPTAIYTTLKSWFSWQPKYQKVQKKYEKYHVTLNNPQESAEALHDAIQKSESINDALKKDPTKFLLGASSSAYQIEGGLDDTDATAQFYKKKGFQVAGEAIDFWNRYKEDIPQMKNELGINSFRLSIAWERVQPTVDTWDEKAIEQYINIIKTLKENGIEPIVMLHHYTIPVWFQDIGGFEKIENNQHFISFATRMYDALCYDVTYWSTFNAIEGYAFKCYYRGENAPGDTNNLQKTMVVMANMLEAHVAVYRVIKEAYKKKSLSGDRNGRDSWSIADR